MDMMRELITKDYNNVIISYWFWIDQFLMAGQVNNGELWLINNFINLKYDVDAFPGGIYFANNEYRDKMVEFYDCPYLLMQKLMFDEKKKIENKDIIDVLLKNISRGNFVIMMVDRFYLNVGWDKGNEHELMVHGYDISKKCFYYADHTQDGRHKTGLSCSFSELKQAFEAPITYRESLEFKNTIFTFLPVQNLSYKLNLDHMIQQLKYYYHGDQNLFDNYYKSGIQVYYDLASYFNKQIVKKSKKMDIRGVTVLQDHNSAMVYRIEYLAKKLKRNFESLKLFEKLKKDSKKMVQCYLKFTITKDYTILKKIIDILYMLDENERMAIKLLIDELSSIKSESFNT